MIETIYEVNDVVQGSSEWHAWRKTGVTATCSPILLQVPGSTKTRYELSLQYLGLIESEDLSFIKQVDAGKKLESLARNWCENKLGQFAAPFCVRNKKFPFMIASLDGQFDDQSILEIKNLSSKKHLDILQNGQNSPEFRYYYWQVQHQLFVTGAPKAFLVFWSSTDQPKVFSIQPHQAAFSRLFDACEKFWLCVQNKRTMPFDKKTDILLLSDSEIMSQTKEFSPPEDLEVRVSDMRRQIEYLRSIEKQYNDLSEKKSRLEESLKVTIQGLATSLGYAVNDPVRIDGYGIRYLETDVKGSTNWKSIAERLKANPADYPDCVNQGSRRSSLSLYEYEASSNDSVHILTTPFNAKDENGIMIEHYCF